MSIQAVSSQAAQVSQSESVSIPRITSTDSTILGQQEKQVKAQIAKLQSKSGNTQHVQQLNQVLQDIQKILQKQTTGAQTQASVSVSSNGSSANAGKLDVKA
ncbi:hypothetical protein [Ethanoligenens sp.]|uniref:hypothetical protein n=1 Tax=Ethanoligenens sp. TaxID=2099655 RepID=UPI0039ED8564